jgi:hypothetical protein
MNKRRLIMPNEWMPKNPCVLFHCPEGDGYSPDDCIRDGYAKDCVHFVSYRKSLAAVEKVLEWQKKYAQDEPLVITQLYSEPVITIPVLDSMLSGIKEAKTNG